MMGTKNIWDGKDLPPIGYDVLTHLGSIDAYVPHKVTGYRTSRRDDGGWTIWINLEASHDKRSAKNCRQLECCYPLDTDPLDLPAKGCLKTPREMIQAERLETELAIGA